MNIMIEVEEPSWITLDDIEAIARNAVQTAAKSAGFDAQNGEIAVLLTDDPSMAEINATWRGKATTTNVLSFPSPPDLPVPTGEARPLGDIVLAYGVVVSEAERQGKSLRDHVIHLIVHGTLHLAGFDHETEVEAREMEKMEVDILSSLGVRDPYE